MAGAPPPFQYSLSLRGHDGPVRSLAAGWSRLGGGGGQEGEAGATTRVVEVLSGSQDAVLRRWQILSGSAAAADDDDDDGEGRASEGASASEGAHYVEGMPIFSHNHWVTAVTRFPGAERELFVTGCLDGHIRVFNCEDGERLMEFEGHEKGVVSLTWTADGKLVSGGWDGKAKIWNLDTGQCERVLAGHENAVVAAVLPNGDIVTGSTGQQVENRQVDFCLRIWRGEEEIRKIERHTAAIRQVGLVPDVGFFSVSNDGSVRLWTAEGDELASSEHPVGQDGPAFILGGCVVSPPDAPRDEEEKQEDASAPSSSSASSSVAIVSTGDDGVVQVWDGGDSVQIIQHPSSVWCACALPNGDFCTGGHDNVIRIFTRDPARAAPAGEQTAFAQEAEMFATRQAQAKGGGNVMPAEEIAKLPHWDARSTRSGQRDGDVQIFQRGGRAIAALWDSSCGTWTEQGEVTGTGDGTVVDGVPYDHAFPIEVEDHVGGSGTKRLQIGVNTGENPFVAAQRFIDKHMLPQTYLAQIADHLQQQMQTGGVPTIDLSGGGGGGMSGGVGGHTDPAALINDQLGMMAQTGTSVTPYEGAAKKKPRTSSSGAAAAVGGGTAAGSVSAPATAGAPQLPVTGCLTFADVPPMDKLKGKLLSLAEGVPEEQRLSERQLQHVDSLLDKLGDKSHYHAREITTAEVGFLGTRVLHWPVSALFPILDVMRLLMLHPTGAQACEGFAVDLVHLAVRANRECEGAKPVLLLSMRYASNCFHSSRHRGAAYVALSSLLAACTATATECEGHAGVLTAAATVCLNSVVELLKDGRVDMLEQHLADALRCIETVLAACTTEESWRPDAAARSLAAFGTLIVHPASATLVCEALRARGRIADTLSRTEDVAARARAHGNEKTAACADEVCRALRRCT